MFFSQKNFETYAMFYRLAAAMHKHDHDKEMMRGWTAHKMTYAFYATHGITNRFQAAFKADHLDFDSAIKALRTNSDSNPDWQAAMNAILANYEERLKTNFAPLHGSVMKLIETYKYDNLPEDMQVIIQDWAEDSIIPTHFKYRLIPLSALPNVPVNKETDSDFDGVRDEVYALKMDLNKVPPIIIANGVLMDGRHRIFSARAKGLKEIHAIDLTGVITERMSRIDGMGPIRY